MNILVDKITFFLVISFLSLAAVESLFAQQSHIPFHKKAHVFHSAKHKVLSGKKDLTYTKRIKSSGAAWLQLKFSDNNLGKKSYLTITSLEDGGKQVLNSRSLKQWKNSSAYFNGDEVEIILHIAPEDRQNDVYYSLEELTVGEQSLIAPLSLCGGTDDRVATNDVRIGRIMPVGCTGWIISNGANLSAGHCAGGLMSIYQFNVPASDPDGTINNPPPEDQYFIDTSSVDYFNDGPGAEGNDWVVFSTFANPLTGMKPAQAQGNFFRLSKDILPSMVRVTGFGIDNIPVGVTGAGNESNQTQQSDAGYFFGESISGDSNVVIKYQVDTLSANSGSPVIDDGTDLAIGIHTDGGCSTFTGNIGTGFKNYSLENAIQNAPGINTFYLDNKHPDRINSGTIFHPAKTLEAVINLAEQGDTVSIVSGSYTENITLDKPLTIVAPVGTVIIGQ